MIITLDSGEQGTRGAVAPSGKKESPAERKELNSCSEGKRIAWFGRIRWHLYDASFLMFGRRKPSSRLREFDFLDMHILLYTVRRMHMW